MISYVLGFAFSKDFSEILLISKNKPEWQKGLYNGVGGKIEAFESPNEAMVREFREESNIDTKAENWKRVCQMGDYSTWDCEVFTTVLDNIHNYKNLTEEKCSVFAIRNYDGDDKENMNKINLPSNCIENLKWLIPLCIDCYEKDIFVSVTYN
jgi:8-oxo-dGTP diphosphatase